MQTIAAQTPLDVLRGCWARLVKAAKPAAPRRVVPRRQPSAPPAIDLWQRLVKAAKPGAPQRFARRRPPQERGPLVPAPLPAASIDPVALTILAVNRLGPATFRTVSLGLAVTVTVPDQATGDIFRAALAEMQKSRLTDRLVRIEIAKPAPAAEIAP
jgi:hypothetical protein